MALFLTGTVKTDRKVAESERGRHVAKDRSQPWGIWSPAHSSELNRRSPRINLELLISGSCFV